MTEKAANEILDYKKHEGLRLSMLNSFEFAKSAPMAAVALSEIARVGHYCPVVFPEKGELNPVAVFSYFKGQNPFVDKAGKWTAPYVPGVFRFFPFSLARVEKKKAQNNPAEKTEDKLALCVQPQAPHFQAGMGDPLFTADGKPVDMVLKVFEALQKHHQELAAARQIFSVVEAKGGMGKKTVTVQLPDGSDISHTFRCVNMEKVYALDDKTLAEWTRKGIIAFIYDHVRSLVHLKG